MEHTLQELLDGFYLEDLDLSLAEETLDCFSFQQEEY